MNIKKIILVLIFAASANVSAQTFVNPGIKLGYAFGKEEGFIFGFEISVTSLANDWIQGIVLDYDIINNLRKVHLGFEVSRGGVGLDAGPTIALENGNVYYGFSIIPYAGVAIYPYYNFTYLWKKGALHEAGSYLKISFGKIPKFN